MTGVAPLQWSLEEIEAERSRRSLAYYFRKAWPWADPSSFLENWHLDAMAEYLEAVTNGEIRRLIVNVPPRTMKSLLVSVFWPTWVWTLNPQVRWLFGSYAESLAMRDSKKCRRLIKSPWYQDRFGHGFAFVDDQNQAGRFETDKGGYRIATSVGGSATGEGGDVLVLDDPNKIEEAHSKTKREDTNDWVDQTWSMRMTDPARSAQVVVQQRVHREDVTGHLISQSPDEWTILCLPMEYEPAHPFVWPDDPRTEDGELLWPERFTPAAVESAKKRLGSLGTAGQLQQRPAPKEGRIFKRKHWRWYTRETGEALLDTNSSNRAHELMLSFDMSFGETDDSSYVAGLAWARRGADRFLLPIRIHDRLDFPDALVAVKQLKAVYPLATTVLVEKKANGAAIISTLKQEIAGLVAYNPHESKEARAHAVSPQVEAGNVYLPDWEPWILSEYLDEMSDFPNAPNDDYVDATTQALLRWRGGEIGLGPDPWNGR